MSAHPTLKPAPTVPAPRSRPIGAGTIPLERICSRTGCGHSIEHLRSDARYCNSSCRREAARARHSTRKPAKGAPLFDWSSAAARGVLSRRRGRTRYAERGKDA